MQSEIRAMTVECDRLGGINLAQGVCDTPIPAPVEQAAQRAIAEGNNIYTRADGIAPLRAALAERLARHNRMTVDPESELVVTSGATGGLYATCLALLDPGDEVLLFEPFYGYHVNTMRSLGVKPVVLSLSGASLEIDFDALRKAVSPRTRAILINSPNNPCGKVLTPGELERLAEFAIAHDLFVFSDEIYEYFLYDGASHVSMATLPGMAERTITISGLSKTFSITGWRVGYLAASSSWIPSIAYFHDLVYVCSPSPFQYAAAAGLRELPDSFYSDLSAEYQRKRDLLCGALSAAGLTPSIPTGAYYVLADAANIPGTNAREKARMLLRETKVAAVAGSAFYAGNGGDGLLRFCFAKRDAELEKACTAIRSFRA
jgi:aminotransferase